MNEIRKPSPESQNQGFEKGNIITCPSDLTGVKWKVVEKRKSGILLAVVKGGEKYPSGEYPKTMEILPEAFHKWEKVT